jgi:flavin reductase (DIM6/NTAB) family NADH-FMN oxidoreductase RutF
MTYQTDDTSYAAIGKIASGLFILGVTDGELKEAFLASWVNQVSLSPVRLSVVMEADRPAFALAEKSRHFTLNILGETNTPQMKPFWGGLKSGVQPLDVVLHTLSPEGALIVDGILAYAHCVIEAIHPIDGHRLIIGRVLSHGVLNKEDKPKVHIRTKGTAY